MDRKGARTYRRGFTLVEVLIVIAIIVILLAIAIPTFRAAIEKARKAADDANMRAARAAFVVWEMTTGEKPPKNAYFDNVSGTFIDRAVYRSNRSKYKDYGQSYNDNGGRSSNAAGQPTNPPGPPSKGRNAHIYVDVYAPDDYGPEALVWWAVPVTHPKPNWW